MHLDVHLKTHIKVHRRVTDVRRRMSTSGVAVPDRRNTTLVVFSIIIYVVDKLDDKLDEARHHVACAYMRLTIIDLIPITCNFF